MRKSISKQIANQIVALRKERGWTQKDLARFTITKQQVISRIECGKEHITIKTLSRIATAFNKKLQIEFK